MLWYYGAARPSQRARGQWPPRPWCNSNPAVMIFSSHLANFWQLVCTAEKKGSDGRFRQSCKDSAESSKMFEMIASPIWIKYGSMQALYCRMYLFLCAINVHYCILNILNDLFCFCLLLVAFFVNIICTLNMHIGLGTGGLSPLNILSGGGWSILEPPKKSYILIKS